MSRSVETIRDAYVVYFDYSEFDDVGYDWQDMIDNIVIELLNKYKSFREADKWVSYPYRENKIILENELCQISVSEYCSCGAFSIFITKDLYESIIPREFAKWWIEQNVKNIINIIEQYVNPLRKVGAFSNGEAIFERK